MWGIFDQALARFQEIERQLVDPDIAVDPGKYSTLAKEHAKLAKQVRPYQEFLKLGEAITHAEEMVNAETDPEMKSYAETELAALQARRETIKIKLEELVLVDPAEDFDSLIMEIRAGTGGDEAALFAGDLYSMYTRFARERGWVVEDIGFSHGEMGGFKEVVFSVRGEGAFRELRYESGGHRVQRVPKTEQQGRIHTSAATVAILPEPDETQIEIKHDDLEIETMRAGGAGGQHVNKTESAVRIWYKRGTEDELEVKCQDGRSQHKNRDQAMRVLRGRLFEHQQQKIHNKRAEQRRTLIGTGDRSDRIRTYNFPQNRVTDHRINLTIYRLDAVIMGELGELIQGLKDFDRKQRLEGQGT